MANKGQKRLRESDALEYSSAMSNIKKLKREKNELREEIKDLRGKVKAVDLRIDARMKGLAQNPIFKMKADAREKKANEKYVKKCKEAAMGWVYEHTRCECDRPDKEILQYIREAVRGHLTSLSYQEYNLVGRHDFYIEGERISYEFGGRSYVAETQTNDHEEIRETGGPQGYDAKTGWCDGERTLSYRDPVTLDDWKGVDKALLPGLVLIRNPPARCEACPCAILPREGREQEDADE